MSKHIVLAISLSIIATFLAFQVSAFPTYLRDEAPMSIVVDPEEYAEGYGEDYFSPVVMKRFFTNHPSDYNPMRRPGPMPRGSKRDETPYHPVPRIMSLRRSGPDSEEIGGENSDGYITSGRQKKQTRAATLIFRLGSLGMRRKPTVPPGPTA